MAGIIDRAKAHGPPRLRRAVHQRRGLAASSPPRGDCGAPADAAPRRPATACMRDSEARDAMTVLGLTWSTNLNTTELIFLGYPGRRVPDVAVGRHDPVTNSMTGVQRTYAEDFDANVGDLQRRLPLPARAARTRQFTAPAMRADLDALLTATTQPSDIYTHATFDGHPDHAEIGQARCSPPSAARNRPVRLHTTLQHPDGDGDCMALSSARWPNPALPNNNPFARFTPTLDFTAPPAIPCDAADATTSWGPMGAPNEIVDVPANDADDVRGHEQEVADDRQARVADRLHEPGRVPRQLRLHAGVRQEAASSSGATTSAASASGRRRTRRTGRRTTRSRSSRRSSRASGATRTAACGRSPRASTARC